MIRHSWGGIPPFLIGFRLAFDEQRREYCIGEKNVLSKIVQKESKNEIES